MIDVETIKRPAGYGWRACVDDREYESGDALYSTADAALEAGRAFVRALVGETQNAPPR